MEEVTAGLDSLRLHIPAMNRAWYEAQNDEDQTDPDKMHLYWEADVYADDAEVVLAAMAAEAAASIPDGLDADDREGLRWTVVHGETSPAVAFHLQCYEAITTFRHWAAYDDFKAQLDAVELAGAKWLAPLSDTERHDLGAELRRAKARAAEAVLARGAQQSGNTRSASDAKARKRAAWAVFGLDGPEGDSLLKRRRTATDEQLAQLADIYGYKGHTNEFLADLKDKNSTVRSQLKEDARA